MTELKTFLKFTLTTMLSASAFSAVAMTHQSTYIACYGVSKQGPNVPVIAPKGDCKKLADAVVKPLTAAQQVQAAQMKPYTANDYVACYGVAAAGKNDCATNVSACGGTTTVARDPNAWVAIPKGICQQITGGVIGNLKTGKKS